MRPNDSGGWMPCVADGDDPATARFSLAEGVAEVLVDPISPFYLAPMATMLTAAAAVIPKLIAAYRSGEGVAYADYPEGVTAQAGLNRPAFTNDLASWVAAIPDVAMRLATRQTLPLSPTSPAAPAGRQSRWRRPIRTSHV